jgi:hypothetical protein
MIALEEPVLPDREDHLAEAVRAGRTGPRPSPRPPCSTRRRARTSLPAWSSSLGWRGTMLFGPTGGVLVLPLVVVLFMMRVSRGDLSGADPTPAGDADSPNLA